MIRWISDRLGTAPANDGAIAQDMAVLDVRTLVDKSGNCRGATREKLERGAALIREGRRLVVCCDYGISRSNAVAAGILSLVGGISLDQAVREVMEKTGEKEIKLEPLNAVRAALSAPEERDDGATPRILITGGSGFVGELFYARAGQRYFCIAPGREEVDLCEGALALDLSAKEHRINCIVHLANPRVYTSNRAAGATVTMLKNVLDVCRENGIRLIFPSSWEVYAAYRSTGMLAAEDMPLYPKGPYGEAKAICEGLVEHHRKLYGVRCAVLRSATLYGETGDRPRFLRNFIAKALAGDPIQTHRYLNGAPGLDLMHVDDFVAALLASVEKDYAGNLNIGSGTLTSTAQIAELLRAKTGSRSVITSVAVEEYAANVAMDTSLAAGSLGWHPAVGLEAGIDRLLDPVTR